MRRLALLLAIVPAAAFAQTGSMPIDSIHSGAEVRVWSRQPPLRKARLQYLGRTDTTIVFGERRAAFHSLDFGGEVRSADIERLEVYRGLRFDARRIGRGALKGAGLGLLCGVVLGAGIGATAHDGSNGGLVPLGVLVFGTYGTAAGAAIGALSGLRGATQWVSVQVSGAR